MECSSTPKNNNSNLRPKPTLRKGVRVVGKIRALTESEKNVAISSQISILREDDHVSIIPPVQSNRFKDTYVLDECYEHDDSSSKLFVHEVKPLLQGLFHGENCSIIAFGARGSGKSQLIQGSVETPGLAMMAFSDIFLDIQEVGGSIAISCYEMHNDHIYDLLEYNEQEIKVMKVAANEIQLKGLSKIPVKSCLDFENFYFRISNQRKFSQRAEKYGNVRSHKGLIIYVTSVDKVSKKCVVGKLNFMDLAGFDDAQWRKTAKDFKNECSKINKSLCALLNVLRALNSDEPYIAFREAKLTRFLQDYLWGTNKSVLITCLSPILCPHTLRVISMASRSCQFVNKQRRDFTRRNKECRGHFPPDAPNVNPPKYNKRSKLGTSELGLSRKKIEPNILTFKESSSDNRKVKHGLHILGSTRIKIKENVSTSKETTLDSTVKTREISGLTSSITMESPSTSRERKLLNIHPFSDAQKMENQYNIEENVGSTLISVFGIVKEENSLLRRVEDFSITKKDDIEPVDHSQHKVDSFLGCHENLSINPEGFLENRQPSLCFESDKLSPPLSQQLRELSNRLANRFKALSSQSISSDQNLINANIEPKTPRLPLASKHDYNSICEKFATPQEKFKTRSTGLKKSLVNECLDFLNSASKDELKQLKGIGEKRASYILELREESEEPFKNIDDLKGLGLSSKQIEGMMTKILSDI